jgi:hypothetical protein
MFFQKHASVANDLSKLIKNFEQRIFISQKFLQGSLFIKNLHYNSSGNIVKRYNFF